MESFYVCQECGEEGIPVKSPCPECGAVQVVSGVTRTTSWKPEKGWLGKLEEKIPKNAQGDPAFASLGIQGYEDGQYAEDEILSVFTPQQIVHLVNQQLYSLLYQRESHRKRAAAEAETLGPLKKKVKELFGVSYLKATEQQLKEAFDVLAKSKERE